jgi:hypothetical protein
MNCVHGWCISNFMKHNINRTRVLSFCRKTSLLGFDYKLCESSVACTDCVCDLGVLIDSNLHFHHDVDNVFPRAVRFLGLIQIVTFSFFSLQNILVLYCTLVRPKLEYASVSWNPITSTNACELEHIHQKFLSFYHRCFFSHIQLLHYPWLLEISYLKCLEVSSRHNFFI